MRLNKIGLKAEGLAFVPDCNVLLKQNVNYSTKLYKQVKQKKVYIKFWPPSLNFKN